MTRLELLAHDVNDYAKLLHDAKAENPSPRVSMLHEAATELFRLDSAERRVRRFIENAFAVSDSPQKVYVHAASVLAALEGSRCEYVGCNEPGPHDSHSVAGIGASADTD